MQVNINRECMHARCMCMYVCKPLQLVCCCLVPDGEACEAAGRLTLSNVLPGSFTGIGGGNAFR